MQISIFNEKYFLGPIPHRMVAFKAAQAAAQFEADQRT